jgi:hypothetical protein
MAKTIQREMPARPDEKTSETIHPSVLARISSYPKLQVALQDYPRLVWDMHVLEMQLRAFWETKYDPESSRALAYAAELVKRQSSFGSRINRLLLSAFTWPDSGSEGNSKHLLKQDEIENTGTLRSGLPVIEPQPRPIS